MIDSEEEYANVEPENAYLRLLSFITFLLENTLINQNNTNKSIVIIDYNIDCIDLGTTCIKKDNTI